MNLKEFTSEELAVINFYCGGKSRYQYTYQIPRKLEMSILEKIRENEKEVK